MPGTGMREFRRLRYAQTIKNLKQSKYPFYLATNQGIIDNQLYKLKNEPVHDILMCVAYTSSEG